MNRLHAFFFCELGFPPPSRRSFLRPDPSARCFPVGLAQDKRTDWLGGEGDLFGSSNKKGGPPDYAVRRNALFGGTIRFPVFPGQRDGHSPESNNFIVFFVIQYLGHGVQKGFSPEGLCDGLDDSALFQIFRIMFGAQPVRRITGVLTCPG